MAEGSTFALVGATTLMTTPELMELLNKIDGLHVEMHTASPAESASQVAENAARRSVVNRIYRAVPGHVWKRREAMLLRQQAAQMMQSADEIEGSLTKGSLVPPSPPDRDHLISRHPLTD